jgi:multimeric flavodoxin WrbA
VGTVIGIAGSPRRKGNSAALMRAVLKGAAEAGADVKEVYLNGLTFKGCQGCFPCSAKGKCILNDGLTPVMEGLRKADAWVLASPIYYDSVSGQMKAFFDRCRTFTRDPASRELKPQLEGKRKGVVIVVYEDDPRDDYRHEAEKLAHYLSWMGDFGDVEILSEGNLFAADAAADRPDLLARAEELGKLLLD